MAALAGSMSTLRGSIRLLVFGLLLLLATLAIVATAWIPARRRGVRLGAWLLVPVCRLSLRLFNVRFTTANCQQIRQTPGFIFPNHQSFLDVLLLVSILPVRFLSKAELRSWPLVGFIARAIGTVFVDRQNKDSREAARQALAQVDPYPPVVLFPEGGIMGPAGGLKPFRYGAFEIARDSGRAYMPCVFHYEPLAVAFWGDETFLGTVWRLARRSGPLLVRLHCLRAVQPLATDDPRQLALETHGAMAAVLQAGGLENELLQQGL